MVARVVGEPLRVGRAPNDDAFGCPGGDLTARTCPIGEINDNSEPARLLNGEFHPHDKARVPRDNSERTPDLIALGPKFVLSVASVPDHILAKLPNRDFLDTKPEASGEATLPS